MGDSEPMGLNPMQLRIGLRYVEIPRLMSAGADVQNGSSPCDSRGFGSKTPSDGSLSMDRYSACRTVK